MINKIHTRTLLWSRSSCSYFEVGSGGIEFRLSLKVDENGAKEMKPITAVQHDKEEGPMGDEPEYGMRT